MVGEDHLTAALFLILLQRPQHGRRKRDIVVQMNDVRPKLLEAPGGHFIIFRNPHGRKHLARPPDLAKILGEIMLDRILIPQRFITGQNGYVKILFMQENLKVLTRHMFRAAAGEGGNDQKDLLQFILPFPAFPGIDRPLRFYYYTLFIFVLQTFRCCVSL